MEMSEEDRAFVRTMEDMTRREWRFALFSASAAIIVLGLLNLGLYLWGHVG